MGGKEVRETREASEGRVLQLGQLSPNATWRLRRKRVEISAPVFLETFFNSSMSDSSTRKDKICFFGFSTTLLIASNQD